MILITGANGWLGFNLVQSFAQGAAEEWGIRDNQLRCLILPKTDSSRLKALGDKIELLEGDLRNEKDLLKFTDGAREAVLIHTAGIIHPKQIRELFEINRDGTRNLLHSAAKSGVKRAVVVSSNSPCGCNPHPDHRFDENSPYHPYMNYGRSKMEMEECVLEFEKEGILETVLIRAPWFYGPNQPLRQKIFFEMIKDGKIPLVGKGNNLRSMVYIDNLVQGLALSASSAKAPGRIFWIADERPYSMNEIIDTIENLLDEEFDQHCAHRRIHLPNIASDLAEWIDTGLQSMGLYHQKIHVLSEMNKTIACDIIQAQKVLGYDPQISLEEGMHRSLAEIYSGKEE